MKKILSLLLALLLLASFASCGASEGDFDVDAELSGTSSADSDPTVQKISYKSAIGFEVENVDRLKNAITEECNALGGYLYNTDESYEDGECTYVRSVYYVPSDKLQTFLSTIEGKGDVTAKKLSASDVSDGYVSYEARKASLLARKESLEALLEKDVSVSDQITLVKEIATIDENLKSIELELEKYDKLVDYSTVIVYVTQPIALLDYLTPIIVVIVLVIVILAAVLIPIKIVERHKKKKAKAQ